MAKKLFEILTLAFLLFFTSKMKCCTYVYIKEIALEPIQKKSIIIKVLPIIINISPGFHHIFHPNIRVRSRYHNKLIKIDNKKNNKDESRQ